MIENNSGIAVINRGFWPTYPVIGDALLGLAEELAKYTSVTVMTQSSPGLALKLSRLGRGQNVIFRVARPFSSSSSSILVRIFDLAYFTVWIFFQLLRERPKVIYVSTDPPIFPAFLVALYSIIFDTKYVYHVQDIHPEASEGFLKVPTFMFGLLVWIDTFTQRHADKLITITNDMREELLSRAPLAKKPVLISNPGFAPTKVKRLNKKKRGFVFCGNAGRLQLMPILIKSIRLFMQRFGNLEFIFIGGGRYSKEIQDLSNEFPRNVKFFGPTSPTEAAEIIGEYEWALLPIKDEVTRLAFPSKASSYVLANAKIFAICSKTTSVGRWITTNRLGVVVEPDVNSIVDGFVHLNTVGEKTGHPSKKFKKTLTLDYFITALRDEIIGLWR